MGEIAKNKDGQPQDGSAQYVYSKEEKQGFRDDPQCLLEYRQELEATVNLSFDVFLQNSDLSKGYEAYMRDDMLRRIGGGHEELKARIFPNWAPGCTSDPASRVYSSTDKI